MAKPSYVGAFLRKHLEEHASEPTDVEARARFVEAAMAQAKPARAPRLLLSSAAIALVLSLFVALAVHVLRPTPMTFTEGVSRNPATTAQFIISGPTDEVPLYFSDGSVITLAPAARGRVHKTTPNGAVLLVESGALSANVVHREHSDWWFLAGPYSVHVTGTAFVLAWQPAGVLDIQMKSGVVVVKGPGAESGVEVRDHRRFVLGGGEGIASDSAVGAPAITRGAREPAASGEPISPRAVRDRQPASPPHSMLAPPASPERNDEPVVPATATADGTEPEPPVPPPATEQSWSALVAHGEYARVLELARARGLATTLTSANEDELAALADAARFSGRSERSVAIDALGRIRARFAGTARARSAAFLLGRISDDAGDLRTAVTWYERYLSEAPDGTLAAEALGRWMVALQQLHDETRARTVAQRYLERFPAGPHANIARGILGP